MTRRKIIIGGLGGAVLAWLLGLICFNQTIMSYKKQPIDLFKQDIALKIVDNYNGFGTDDFIGFKAYPEQKNVDVRMIALYLPQFHQFKENNAWHGRGFTEWTNVTAAKPLFEGHYQPKLPIDVGFYDLSHDDVMYRQIELAKNYGINGFAFYYYWFSGKKLMEKPIYNYLNNKELDFPFCLHWANENWSKRWDGGNQELLMAQNFSEADFKQFADDILPFFKDERYIKVDGKPLFIVYRPALFGKDLFNKFATYLRQYMRENGVGEIFLLGTKQFLFFDNPKDYGLDGVLDFGIRSYNALAETEVDKYYPKSDFKVFNWGKYIGSERMELDYAYKTFRTVFPRWDNTARKAFSGGMIYAGSTPDIYGRWLKYSYDATKRDLQGEERIIFLNAWNEWAEGAMLEPDRRYGYAYLDMTRQVADGTAHFEPYQYEPIGIVALTGGSNRIDKAVSMLGMGWGDYLLISGVRPGVTFSLISGRKDILVDSQKNIELGYTARNTVGNAKEVLEWTKRKNIKKIYVVTSFYHIPRSRLELKRFMPDVDMHFVAVESKFVADEWWKKWRSLKFLAGEYTKFLIVYLQYLPYRIYRLFV